MRVAPVHSLAAAALVAAVAVPRVASAVDHGGADWTVTDGEDLAGTHTSVGRFVVPAGVTAVVLGGVTRIEARRIEVHGIIDASYGGHAGGGATASNGQPGGGPVASRGLGGQALEEGGGSGAGYGGAGGAGGALATGVAGGGAWGTASGTDADQGAGGGGGATGGTCTGGAGGAGGGRVELVAESIVLGATGLVIANGGNGGSAGGTCTGTNAGGGGGGGAGGAIVLMAPLIRVAGGLHAAGGAGGSGAGVAGNGCSGGGGGGGRIKLLGTVSDLGATFDAIGGAAGAPRCTVFGQAGGDGTVFVEATGTAQPQVPATLDFGGERTGGTPGPATNLVVSNTGTAPFVIDELTVSNGEFVVDPATSSSLPITVAAGSSATLVLKFHPAVGQVGERSATLSIRTNDPAQEVYTTALGGTGLEPDLTSSAGPIAFGNQRVGTTSAAQSFTITNSGNTTLLISSVGTTGAHAADFAATLSGSLSVPPGGSRTVNVTFTPSDTGARSASVSIASDDPSSPFLLAVSGTGVAPQMTVTTSMAPPLTFPTTKVGTTSPTTRTVTVQNTGTDTLNVALSEVGAHPADFAFSPGATSFSLAAGGSQTLTITFTPTAAGARSNVLRVTDVDGFTAAVDVSMSGTGATPSIALSPSPLTFASRRVGTTSPASTVTITNSSSVSLVVSGITTGGTHPADFALTAPATPFTVPAGGTATFQLTFTPQATGSRSATVTVTSDAPTSPTFLDVSGTGLAPVVSITPASLAFGNQRINTTSASQTLSIANTGTDYLTITSFGIPGLNAEDYVITGAPPAGTVLLPSDPPIVVSIAFHPLATGAQNATLVIGTDDPVAPPNKNVSLGGTGTTALLAVSPASRDFGNQVVGTASAGFGFTVSNPGTAPLSLGGVSFGAPNPGEFGLVSPTSFPVTIAAGGSTTVSVRFQPTSVGVKASSLVLATDADNAGSVAAPTLTGNGVKPDISIGAGGLVFGNQRVGTTSAPQTIAVENVGTSPLSVAVGTTGANPADFAASPTSFVLAPGATQHVSVTFAPIALGARTAAVRFTSDDQETPVVDVPVSGNGVSPEITLLSPASGTIDFGSVRVGEVGTPVNVVIRNDGAMNLTVTGITLTGGDAGQFTLTPPGLPAEVAPGATLSAIVNFAPTTTGAKSTTVRIDADDDNEPETFVTLTGTATQQAIVAIPAAVGFGQVRVGETGADVTVTLRNAGTAPLTVSAVMSTLSVFPIVTPPPTLPVVLSPGGETTLVLDFVPVAFADYGGALIVMSDDPNGDLVVPVTGQGRIAEMEITPAPVSYGEVRVDGPGVTTTVTVQNIGSAPFWVSSVTVSDPVHFSVSPLAGPVSLSPGATLPLAVTAHPAAVGTRTATLSVSTDIPGMPVSTVTLVAQGVAPLIQTTCMEVDFGAVDVQAGPKTHTCTVSNVGSAPLVLSNLAITGANAGAFSIASAPTVPVTIPRMGLSTIVLAYDPDVERMVGTDDALFTIASDALGATLISANLRGYGIDRHLGLSAMRLDFPPTRRNSQEGARLGVRITNNGDAVLALPQLRVEGAGASAFSIEGAPPTAVGPRDFIDVVVKFVPTAANLFDADLVITSDDDERPMALVDLVGQGIVWRLDVAPLMLDVRTVAVGVTKRSEQDVTVTNMEPTDRVTVAEVCVGATPLACDAGTPFRVAGWSGPRQLAPLDRLRVHVDFTPGEARVYRGYLLVFAEDDPAPIAAVTLDGQGIDDVFLEGGGCGVASRGRGAAGALMVVVAAGALLSARRRPRGAALLVALAIAGAPGAAAGNGDRALDLGTFRPSPGGGPSLVTVEQPATAPDGTIAVGLFVDYARNPLVSRRRMSTVEPDVPVSDRTAFLAVFSYALGSRLELGGVLPILEQSGHERRTGVVPAEGTALGDVGLHAKLFLLDARPLSLGLSASLTLPTGDDSQFAGARSVTGHGRAILGMSFGALRLAGNVGFRLRPEEAVIINVRQGDEMTYGVGAGYRLASGIDALGEVYGALGLEAESSRAVSPLEGVGAVRWRPVRELALTVGAGRGILRGIGAPDVRVFAAMSWSPGYEPLASTGGVGGARRGRPAIVDRGDDDQDGIMSSDDRCPLEAEDVDRWEDDDGCPDLDNDEDKIPDALDRCPFEAEDPDGHEDEDGCIDPDDDGDGVPDVNDLCPDTQEDRDGFQDGDGCDDPDNDGDGIPDVIDQCALERETINGVADEDGCPDEGKGAILVLEDRLELVEPVQFVGDTANLKPASRNVLNQLAAVLRANAWIKKVRIGGHVASRGKPEVDEALSRKRAEAVRKYLIERGIDPERLEIKAWGSTRPLKGPRDLNDRIEILIIEKTPRR